MILADVAPLKEQPASSVAQLHRNSAMQPSVTMDIQLWRGPEWTVVLVNEDDLGLLVDLRQLELRLRPLADASR